MLCLYHGYDFLNETEGVQVRSTGETPNQTDVVRVAKLFHDDITLDNLSRSQLVSMCRYMNINAFGTDNFLKHQIRSKLEKFRVDDMVGVLCLNPLHYRLNSA